MTTLHGAGDEHVAEFLPEWINGSLDAVTGEMVARHVAVCSGCAAEAAEWRNIAAASQEAAPEMTAPDHGLAEVWRAIDGAPAAGGRTTVGGWWRRPMPRPMVQGAIAASVLVALTGALVFTPMGSYAQGLITIFQPKQFVAIPMTLEELGALPALERYGTLVQPSREQPVAVASAAEAATRSRLAVPMLGSLPPGLRADPTYFVADGKTASFTFSAAKAATAAAAGSEPLPPMPATIDGSQIVVTTNPVVVVTYRDQNVAAETETREALRSGAAGSRSLTEGRVNKTLIVARTTVPSVRSTGASVAQLQQYLLAQPGVSPDLARAIRSIGDPTTTLPIPIPVDKALSHAVTIQGTSGLAIGDSTGIGGGIVWQRDGIITGVAGTFAESELLAIANSIR